MQPCPVCPRLYSPIPGDGPSPARVLLIGERPGADENKHQQVFIGKTGEELNETYLPLAGLDRGDVRICNAVLCWADNNRTPTQKEILACAAHHLPTEIRRTKPELIVLLGGSACKLLERPVQLDTEHGRPIKVRDFAGSGFDQYVWVSYHPALGIHETSKMTPLLEDFENLGRFLNGNWTPPSPPIRNLDYRQVIREDIQALTGALRSAKDQLEIALDSESHGSQPFSIQYSFRPGESRIALASDKEFLKAFNSVIQDKKAVTLMHNSPAEFKTGLKLGVYPNQFRDTMQEAFHQGNLPQALKPLSYRLFGVRMRSWEDVVRPASESKALEWIGEALMIAATDFSLYERKQLKTKARETYKRGPVESALRRIIRCSNNPDYDLWQKVEEMWNRPEINGNGQREHIEARIGSIPILGIGNCKLSDAIEYACGDADWTLQVAGELKRRRGEQFEIEEDDGDADTN